MYGSRQIVDFDLAIAAERCLVSVRDFVSSSAEINILPSRRIWSYRYEQGDDYLLKWSRNSAGHSRGRFSPVSYTHLTLPTRDLE